MVLKKDELSAALPDLGCNKKYLKFKKYNQKKRQITQERDMPVSELNAKQRAIKKKKAAKKATDAKTGVAKVKKGAKPKTEIHGAKTGRETLVKKKARELVNVKREEAKVLKKQNKKKAKVALEQKTRKEEELQSDASYSAEEEEDVPVGSMAKEETEKELLARAIRGDSYILESTGSSFSDPSSLVRQDPTLYPDLAFFEDYAGKKVAEAVSEDELLMNAHKYFKKLGRQERSLRRVAMDRIKKLKKINRQGGDKDGFRYILPKDPRQVVRQLMAAKGMEGADVDPETLVSAFGGDGVRETESKPVRRKRRRTSTFSDFYQSQVSKRWTRNAENFLKRGRADKSLFEAKKHQRSIKKL